MTLWHWLGAAILLGAGWLLRYWNGRLQRENLELRRRRELDRALYERKIEIERMSDEELGTRLRDALDTAIADSDDGEGGRHSMAGGNDDR